MRARHLVLPVVFSLAACSGGTSPADSKLHEALAWFGDTHDDPVASFQFYDMGAIRDTLDLGGEHDPDDIGPAQRWGHVGLRPATGFLFAPLPKVEKLVIAEAEWTASSRSGGSQGAVIAGLGEAPDEVISAMEYTRDGDQLTPPDLGTPLRDETDFRVFDDVLVAQLRDAVVAPDAPNPAVENPQIAALLPCLDAPHAAYVTAGDVAYGVAATVDEQGVGTAWSCIHAPNEAEGVAADLAPQLELVTMGTPEVDGDVIRTPLTIETRDRDMIAGELRLIHAGPELEFPGF